MQGRRFFSLGPQLAVGQIQSGRGRPNFIAIGLYFRGEIRFQHDYALLYRWLIIDNAGTSQQKSTSFNTPCANYSTEHFHR